MTDRTFGAEVVGNADEIRLQMRGDLDSRADEALSDAYREVATSGSSGVTLEVRR